MLGLSDGMRGGSGQALFLPVSDARLHIFAVSNRRWPDRQGGQMHAPSMMMGLKANCLRFAKQFLMKQLGKAGKLTVGRKI